MRIIYIFLIVFLTSKCLFGNIIFETKEYELNFSSNNINLIKEKKINEIKIKSFQNLIKKLLTKKNQKKMNLNNINFINSFILNYKINNEKIINNNYYAKIKVNFNEKLIINYFIENKIEFINTFPDKFLLIILEKNELNTYLFSDENIYYKYLNTTVNQTYKKYFKIPNLDFNDRFIFNENHFINDVFNQNNQLNKNSKISIKNLSYDKLFDNILLKTINKWKEINQINTSINNKLECKLKINNINELRYVSGLLKSNILVQNLTLKMIELNSNLYSILFLGDIENFKNSLERRRLNLFYQNDLCNIKLI